MIDAKAAARFIETGFKNCPSYCDELNELDARLGDGDLGTTVSKCSECVKEMMKSDAWKKGKEEGESLSEYFKMTALACAKASGSSFGTLLAQGFLTASKETAEKSFLTSSDLSALIDHIVEGLMKRGGAVLGDKTMLDSLSAISDALKKVEHPEFIQIIEAAESTVIEFRDKPNKIGRARMFSERSIGLEDPGQVAILRFLQNA